MLNPILQLNSDGRFVNVVLCEAHSQCPPFVILERVGDLIECPTCRQTQDEGPDILTDELIDVLRHFRSKD